MIADNIFMVKVCETSDLSQYLVGEFHRTFQLFKANLFHGIIPVIQLIDGLKDCSISSSSKLFFLFKVLLVSRFVLLS